MTIEKLNPFARKGRLSFGPFLGTILGTSLLNVMIFITIRSQLIPARVALDKSRTAILYGIWFVLSLIAFSVISNSFIKRWRAILGKEDLGGWLKSCIRFALLSPLFAYPMTLVTLLYFPQGPLTEKENGGDASVAYALLAFAFAMSLAIALVLPGSVFGIEKIDFRKSLEPYAAAYFASDKNPVPSPRVLKPLLAAATPGARYLAWLASDFVRTRAVSVAIEVDAAHACTERMGFLGVEVKDCYFTNLRKMGAIAPFVSPYFAMYFEAQYRRPIAEALSKTEVKRAIDGFAADLLMLSNLLELVEPGPMFVERTHFLRPSLLLHAFGSPEVPLVEGGQDVQRISLIEKILPSFEAQGAAIKDSIDKMGSAAGADEVTIRSEFADLERRIAAIKRDPLMLAKPAP